MAIIKCPECGHQISDKAPVCPSCGVEIAGKVTKCPNCGEVYFKDQEMCPNCHRPTYTSQPPIPPTAASQASAYSQGTAYSQASTSQSQASTIPPTPQSTTRLSGTPTPPPIGANVGNTYGGNGNASPQGEEKKKKGSRSILIVSFIFAVLVCGVMYYFYDSANRNKEQEAYEYAMQSSDPMVLQSYLDTYKEADEAHRDSIMAHLNMLQQVDQDWTNALVSGSKEALEAYLQKYPNSPHKQEVWNKIDSIDWQMALKDNTVDGYQAYLDAHADGSHIEEAEEALQKIKSSEVQPEESQVISGLFRQFFQSINSRNEDGLTATCEDILSSLLGKTSATKSDVVTFMHKLYKEDVSNMNWHLNNDYKVKKREVGDQEYEFQVQFTARQDVDKTDGSKTQNNYKINATVSPSGKISAFNMAKVTTE